MTDQTASARTRNHEGGNGYDRSAPIAGTGGVEPEVRDSDGMTLPADGEPIESLDGLNDFGNAPSIEPAPRFSLRTRRGQRALARFLARELNYSERKRFAELLKP